MGYDGKTEQEMRPHAKALCRKYGEARVTQAISELTLTPEDNRAVLRPEARKACFSLLGPSPDYPLADFLRHGPADVMGEEAAQRWREEYRRRKAAETTAAQQTQGGATAEGQEQAAVKKRPRKERGR